MLHKIANLLFKNVNNENLTEEQKDEMIRVLNNFQNFQVKRINNYPKIQEIKHKMKEDD